MSDTQTPSAAVGGPEQGQPPTPVPVSTVATESDQIKEGKYCPMCQLPTHIRREVNRMLRGTPGDPNAVPPVKASWVAPKDISIWLMSQDPQYAISIDTIRSHQYVHLGIRRLYKAQNDFAEPNPNAPPPPTPTPRSAFGEKLGGATNTTLPARPRTKKKAVQAATVAANQQQAQAPVDSTDEAYEAQEVSGEVVESPQVEEDNIDQLALAPRLPNTDVAYAELAVREFSKTHAKLSREIRKRPGMQMTQAEALVLVNGMPQIIQGVLGLRQIYAMGKGGRFGAPEVVDQKRGLKQLLHNDRAVIPGDVPPKDAEPVGKPVPLQEQLAPVPQTLPVGKEGLPEKSPPPPPITLSDLQAPAAPPSSPRPVIEVIVQGPTGGIAPTAEPAPAAKAVGADTSSPVPTQGSGAPAVMAANDAAPGAKVGSGGATVTPIRKWDALT
jgi:hypothetical protein